MTAGRGETDVAIHVARRRRRAFWGGAVFDAGIAALVLCTVPDQSAALAELFRVIRPAGELRFYEHVIARPKWEARFQRLADATLWPHFAGGCHLARDTTTAIECAGFQVEMCERFPFSPAPLLPADPHILGVARRRDKEAQRL